MLCTSCSCAVYTQSWPCRAHLIDTSACSWYEQARGFRWPISEPMRAVTQPDSSLRCTVHACAVHTGEVLSVLLGSQWGRGAYVVVHAMSGF
jgi:hypothetical protein